MSDSLPPLCLKFPDALFKRTSIGHGSLGCGSEKCNPTIQALIGGITSRRSDVSRAHQPIHVLASERGEHQGDRWQNMRDDSPASQNDIYERPTRPSIAITERMDRFELCVSDGCLRDRRKFISIAEFAQVLEQTVNLLRRWRHEGRVAWTVVSAAYPILVSTNHSPLRLKASTGHQAAVDFSDVINRDRVCGPDLTDGPGHGRDIAEDFLCCDVSRSFAQRVGDFSMEQPPTPDFKAFDLG